MLWKVGWYSASSLTRNCLNIDFFSIEVVIVSEDTEKNTKQCFCRAPCDFGRRIRNQSYVALNLLERFGKPNNWKFWKKIIKSRGSVKRRCKRKKLCSWEISNLISRTIDKKQNVLLVNSSTQTLKQTEKMPFWETQSKTVFENCAALNCENKTKLFDLSWKLFN